MEVLQEMIKIESVSKKEEKIMRYVKDYLEDIGVQNVFLDGFQANGETLYNVEAWSGSKPKLILNGHLDTVELEPEKWKITHPLEPKVIGSRIYGRGSVDTKGSTTAAIEALHSLVEGKNQIDGLVLIGECDEETDFSGANRFIEKYRGKIKPEFCIFCEPSDNEITNEQKGLWHADLTIRGEAKHGSHASLAQTVKNGRVVDNAVNAIEKMHNDNILLELINYKNRLASYKPHSTQGCVTFNIGAIRGADRANTIPTEIIIKTDSRVPINYSAKQISSEFEEQFKKLCDVKIHSVKEAIRIDLNNPQLEKFVESYKEVLGKPKYRLSFGYTELEMYNRGFDTPSIAFGAGPVSSSHGPDEYAEIPKLVKASKVYENAIKAFCCKNNS